MKIITFLTFAAGLTASYAAAAPSLPLEVIYPDDIVVKYFPDGLPAGLYPGTGLTSRITSLEKRQVPPIVVNAPGVGPQTSPAAAVYACSNRNFSGRCVLVRSRPGQCGA
jgi:hypothetical protein